MRYRSIIFTNTSSGCADITFAFVTVGIPAMFSVKFKGISDLYAKHIAVPINNYIRPESKLAFYAAITLFYVI
jgi:hypothetical protein